MSRLKILQEEKFDQRRKNWESSEEIFQRCYPIKRLKKLPKMVGITEEAKRYLKWKALKWIAKEDHTGGVRREILKHPFRYGFRYLKSLFKRNSFKRDEDFYLYGIDSVEDFYKLIDENSLLVVGFSYCQKPLECPSGRFTDQCTNELGHPVCSQCPIGKMRTLMPKSAIPLIIPTVHYIGEQVLKLAHENPKKRILFLITACEMTLEMFGDFGNMVGIQGIGVRLDGRICNTMEAFALSERGIKPGLTVVLKSTEERMLEILKKVY